MTSQTNNSDSNIGTPTICIKENCKNKVKDPRLEINSQPIHLCDIHSMEFIRKTNTKLCWSTD